MAAPVRVPQRGSKALTWVANELAAYAGGLRAGDLVITGTCVEPVPIAPGERLRVDFGRLGAIDAAFEPA